jgi:hypothetical protein
MKIYKVFAVTLLALAAAASPLYAQQSQPVRVPGFYYASNYGRWSVPIQTGTAATGAGTLLLYNGSVVLGDGRTLNPFNVNAPVSVDSGTARETVTPTAVSGCGGVNVQNSCAVTATYANVHGAQALVMSGTGGLQEAINDAVASGGGTVVIDASWAGTNTILAAATMPPTVVIEDRRAGGVQFWANRPTTLTVLAAPGASTQTPVAPAGIAAATYRVCQTYVDALGGETACSTDGSSTVTTTGTLGTINVPAPAALAGAVGWRLYISAAAGGAGSEILYNPVAAVCTPSTLVTAISACAMSSAANPVALVTGTAPVPVQATAHVNAPQPFNSLPQQTPFQTVYGPFTALATISTIQQAGEVQIPSGYLNFLGKSVRVCGEVASVPVGTAVPTYTLTLGPNFSTSPITLVSWTYAGTALTAVNQVANFCAVMTTAATGATGTLEVHGNLTQAIASTGLPSSTTAAVITDGNTAASSTVNLTGPLVLAVTYASATANTTSATLRQLTIEAIN